MNLTPAQVAKAIDAVKTGKAAPTGPIIEVFDPVLLARAIRVECARVAVEAGPQKISLHMDPQDALLLAEFLDKSPRKIHVRKARG